MASISQVKNWVEITLKSQKVPFIIGSPGTGKSDSVKQIAKKFNLELIDVRLSQMDPLDILGMPKVVDEKFHYIPSNLFPLETDEIPEGKNGWLVFLDELSSCAKAVEVAAYKIILDRMVGLHRIHPKALMAAAGNKNTDGAVARSLGTAMQSRLVTLELDVNKDDWIKWANENDIDHRIMSFIEFRPDALMSFDPNHNDYTFPCPRTWAMLSDILDTAGDIEITELDLIAGCIGKGMSRDLFSHIQVADALPNIDDIMNSPKTIKIPTEPFDARIAIAGMVSHYANEDNLSVLMDFLVRLPIENQVIAVRNMIQKNKDMYNHTAIQHWIKNHVGEILL